VDVATFLLNEKRSDIHRIESRLKVGITLIPNPHLETPNYSINRLRQDDMTSEVLQASYKLVEKPVEEMPLTAAQEQQKAARAQAVVQGVTPMKAAPVQAEAATPSLFGKILAWFKSSGEEEQPKAKPAAARPRNAPRPERGERPEGGGKRRDRGGRGERPEGAGRDRSEARGKPAQTEAKPQEPRQPKPPRQRPAEVKPALESQVATAAVEQAEAAPPREGGRRRGRRGGRKEREHRENAAALATNGEAVSAQRSFEQMETAPVGPAPISTGPTEYIAYPDGFVKPSEYIAMPTISATGLPAVMASTLPAAMAPTQIVVAAPTAPVVVAAAPAAKTMASNLVQIETDPIKLSTVAQFTATPAQRHAPRRRERQREVYVENEPLVQIETQHPQG
jgi:ribonuclease E